MFIQPGIKLTSIIISSSLTNAIVPCVNNLQNPVDNHIVSLSIYFRMAGKYPN